MDSTLSITSSVGWSLRARSTSCHSRFSSAPTSAANRGTSCSPIVWSSDRAPALFSRLAKAARWNRRLATSHRASSQASAVFPSPPSPRSTTKRSLAVLDRARAGAARRPVAPGSDPRNCAAAARASSRPQAGAASGSLPAPAPRAPAAPVAGRSPPGRGRARTSPGASGRRRSPGRDSNRREAPSGRPASPGPPVRPPRVPCRKVRRTAAPSRRARCGSSPPPTPPLPGAACRPPTRWGPSRRVPSGRPPGRTGVRGGP